MAAEASGGSEGATEASGPRPMTSPIGPQPAGAGRGGSCNTLKFSNSRMLIGKIIKQRFSYNFKFLPNIYLLYEKFSIGKSIDCFSKLN
jgi:hypothetical protein